MSAWRDVTLGDVIELHDHKRVPLSAAVRRTRQGPFPYYGAQGVIDHIDDYIFDGRYILIPEDGENLNSRKLPIAYFAEGKFWVNNHAHIARARDGVAVDRFVQSALEGSDISGFITGAAQPKLSQVNLLRIPLRVPPFDDQLRIGEILDAIDDLIENNRRRIALLERMALAIYREWFVHFRYPGHEDDELVDSPLGPIPAGWDVKPLDEVATIVRGRSYRKNELVDEGGVPFINLKCMARGGGFRRDGLKRYAGPFKQEQVIRPGDIVLAVTDLTQAREILARATLVPRLFKGEGVISLDVARVVPDNADDRIPLFAALRYSDLADRVKEYANGSTVLHLSPDHIAAAEIVWPSEPVRHRMNEVLGSTYEMADELGGASDGLASLRDLLLPKLVTGAIDVSDLDLDALLDKTAA